MNSVRMNAFERWFNLHMTKLNYIHINPMALINKKDEATKTGPFWNWPLVKTLNVSIPILKKSVFNHLISPI